MSGRQARLLHTGYFVDEEKVEIPADARRYPKEVLTFGAKVRKTLSHHFADSWWYVFPENALEFAV